MYSRLVSWIQGVERHNMKADVFWVVDTHAEDHARTKENLYAPMASRRALPKINSSIFDDMLRSVGRVAGYVAFHDYDEPPLCETRPCLCGHNMTYYRWWEQMAKNERCMRLVEEHEHARGSQYAWVLKAKTEYRWKGARDSGIYARNHRVDYDGISVDSFLHAVRTCAMCTWTNFYNGEDCWAMMDWAAIMPRTNPAFMTIASASCHWITNTSRHFLNLGWEPGVEHEKGLHCQTNERWLAKWMQDVHMAFRRIPEPSELAL